MNENQMLIFTLTVDQANLILQALGEVPFKVSAPVVQELQKQATAQMQPENYLADEEDELHY